MEKGNTFAMDESRTPHEKPQEIRADIYPALKHANEYLGKACELFDSKGATMDMYHYLLKGKAIVDGIVHCEEEEKKEESSGSNKLGSAY